MATPLTRAEWLDECAKLAKTYEEAMTDEAKALMERLRWGAWYYEDPFDGKAYASDDPLEAADLIETQAREIERLTQGHRFFAASVLDFYRVCNANRVHDEVLITGEVTAAFNRLYGHIANLARVARNLDLRETDNTCSGVSGQIFKGGKWVWP